MADQLHLPVDFAQVMKVAELDTIAQIDILPRPSLSRPELYDLSYDELPDIVAPDDRVAIVGLVDSGVASAHPLISPAIVASEAIGAGIDEEQDQHGHGTLVASLLLYGDILSAITSGSPLRPSCRIVSARVLDADNNFPFDHLWERDLQEAICWCADQGASVINLSIGDSRSPFSPPRQMSAASIVDELARQLGLVIVVATGNMHPRDYLTDINEPAAREYLTQLYHNDAAGLLDPATSLLSLTAGGLTEAAASGALSRHETLRRRPMGEPGWPSPVTRRGPGPRQAIKPELVERAGTFGIEDGQLVSNDPELAVIGAAAKAGHLLAWNVGTSYAAPLISRVAASVATKFPDFTAELIRALVLVSSTRLQIADNLDGPDANKRKAELALVGYGRPSIHLAIESTSHRVLLVAESSIQINRVHIYNIPIPSNFMDSGGKRGLDVALAFSPRTRVRRLDYMANRLEFEIVKGLSLEEASEIFAKIGDDDVSKVSELGSKRVKLEPSTKTRSRGANQLGRKVFQRPLKDPQDSPLLLIVRSVNRWDDTTAEQSYALAVALWRDENHTEIFSELEAQLEAVIEAQVEIEIRA